MYIFDLSHMLLYGITFYYQYTYISIHTMITDGRRNVCINDNFVFDICICVAFCEPYFQNKCHSFFASKMQWNKYEKGVMVLIRVLVQTSWFMIATYVLLVSNVASGPWSFNATKRVNASLVHGCCRPWSGWPMRVMTCLELDH